MNKSGGVVPKVLRFPSFKSLNCQPFPDFIDSHKSCLQLETVCLFTTAREIKNLVINELGSKRKNSCKFNTKFIVHKKLKQKNFVS